MKECIVNEEKDIVPRKLKGWVSYCGYRAKKVETWSSKTQRRGSHLRRVAAYVGEIFLVVDVSYVGESIIDVPADVLNDITELVRIFGDALPHWRKSYFLPWINKKNWEKEKEISKNEPRKKKMKLTKPWEKEKRNESKQLKKRKPKEIFFLLPIETFLSSSFLKNDNRNKKHKTRTLPNKLLSI